MSPREILNSAIGTAGTLGTFFSSLDNTLHVLVALLTSTYMVYCIAEKRAARRKLERESDSK
jgi:hypothetical protein